MTLEPRPCWIATDASGYILAMGDDSAYWVAELQKEYGHKSGVVLERIESHLAACDMMLTQLKRETSAGYNGPLFEGQS